ncbi:hypothetical protein [Pseudomonas frederiksbergensis]|uniref:hypothetical protein n=1 Tax=Pseudomonas frederiksbergensis TaxID=104087 RepID=UPI003D20F6B3
MSAPVIQANTSLVRNGDFREGLTQWIKGPINPSWLGTESDGNYPEGPIRYLTAGNGSSVSQLIDVPKDYSEHARYALSFLYETTHTRAGRLEISIERESGAPEPQVIPLPPRNSQEDGQPLAFRPIRLEVDLTLALRKDDKIRVSVFSPENDNPNDYASRVCITRIKLLLHLGPLALEHLTVDGQLLPPERPLYLCLGASGSLQHSLGFVPVANNTWLDTQAALFSENNPQEAIVTTPGLGTDHPLDSEWLIDCPLIDGDGPHLFSLTLFNQYTAEAYPIPVSLGHHRLAFREVREAAYYPVFEYGQGVRLGVQVVSHYTGQALSGLTVNWGLQGQQPKKFVVTDNEGWAWFDFQPASADLFVIEASVQSLYYASGRLTQALNVRVLATDPWKDVMAVVDGIEAPWNEKTGYPNRGSRYPVVLKLPDDSPLQGTDLWLQSQGDSLDQLGVTVSPALDEPVSVIDSAPVWMLECEDRLDGRFDLSLGCSKLLLASGKKPMSLARNEVRIGGVQEANKFPIVDENESVLLRVQVVHVGSGDSVINALVDWVGPDETVSTVTGAGGWANFWYTPRNAGDQVIIASVKAHPDALAVERSFNVKALANSPWRTEVKIFLDDVEVDRVALGVLCWRGQLHTLKVEPVAASQLIGKSMILNWRGTAPAIGLVPSDLGVPRPLPSGGLEWTFSSQMATSVSSLFELELHSDALSSPRELFGRLISPDLVDEMSVVLDQIPATIGNQTLYPCLGALHRFNVLPHALSPLTGLQVILHWSGTPPAELGATVDPELNAPQVISDGGALWCLDFKFSEQNGRFSLAVELPQLGWTSTVNEMELGHHKLRIGALREAAVDPVAGQDLAWMWVQVFSAFTGQPVQHAPVSWTATGAGSIVETDADGWAGYGFAPSVAQQYDVDALVVSPYDGYQDTSSTTVTALASDPWEGLMVSFDQQTPQPWGAKTYFPRRKGEHLIELLAQEGSPLFGQDLTLGLTGTGPAELGVSFVPAALGIPQWFSSVGLRYTVKGGDLKDGSFALRLSASRLAKLSPANAMSLGEGTQVVKIIANNRAHLVLDWEQELYEQVTVVSVISGKPMRHLTVTWRSPDLGVVTLRTDYYGVAKIRFTPLTPGAAELTVTVGDEWYSEAISLPFTVNEPRKIQALVSPQSSGYPGEEVSATATVVSVRTGEPLSGVEVMWALAGVSLAPTMTGIDGVATVWFKLPMNSDALMASVQGGVGGWDVAHLLFSVLEDELVIEKIVCDEPTVYLGDNANAGVFVVTRHHGLAMENIDVAWSFPGLELTPSSTDANGFTSVEFKPRSLGEHDLTVVVGKQNPDSKVQRFSVRDPVTSPDHATITEIHASRNPIRVQDYAQIRVRVMSTVVQLPLPGRRVVWKVLNAQNTTVTDHDGWVGVSYRAYQPGTLIFTFEVQNPGGGVERGSLSITVNS